MPESFATLLTCIDGRIQQPLREWVRDRLAVDHVDTITEPGPSRVLVGADDAALRALLDKVAVSRRAHGSTTLVVAAHSDCAGNPVPDEAQYAELREAANRLSTRLPGTTVLAVHTASCGHGCWRPDLVAEVGAAAGT